jgi:predicted ArsR family transcriptional regulator
MSAGKPTRKIHRALADERRRVIVDALQRSPAGLDVQELAERLGLHPNTVRWHLGVLADAGIVSSRAAGRTTPGRPRIVYALRADSDAGDTESYHLLATMLVGALAEVEDGEARAEAAGRAWGRYLVKRPPPNVRVDEAGATREVIGLLAEQGFRPEAAGEEIRMHHCPYRDLAPGLVCSIHRGIIEGALAELGSELEIGRLDAFVEPELCVACLRTRTAPADAGP